MTARMLGVCSTYYTGRSSSRPDGFLNGSVHFQVALPYA